MARYGRAMAMRPVQRIKHVVDFEGVVDETPVVTADLIVATDTPTLAVTNSVQTGSTVHGIYLRVEAVSSGGSGRPNLFMCIFKNPGAALSAAGFDPRAIGSIDIKRYVIHQEMVMLSSPTDLTDGAVGVPRTVFNGVIRIPKGMKRFGPNDELSMNIVMGNASLVDADWCLECHYKEFR